MPRSKAVARQRDPLPENFASLKEFWEFWDTHSTADYEDLMETVAFSEDVRLKQNELPAGWDEERIRQVLTHYEQQTEEEAVAEDEAPFDEHNETLTTYQVRKDG